MIGRGAAERDRARQQLARRADPPQHHGQVVAGLAGRHAVVDQAHVVGPGGEAGRERELVLQDVGDLAHRAVRCDAHQADEIAYPAAWISVGSAT